MSYAHLDGAIPACPGTCLAALWTGVPIKTVGGGNPRLVLRFGSAFGRAAVPGRGLPGVRFGFALRGCAETLTAGVRRLGAWLLVRLRRNRCLVGIRFGFASLGMLACGGARRLALAGAAAASTVVGLPRGRAARPGRAARAVVGRNEYRSVSMCSPVGLKRSEAGAARWTPRASARFGWRPSEYVNVSHRRACEGDFSML